MLLKHFLLLTGGKFSSTLCLNYLRTSESLKSVFNTRCKINVSIFGSHQILILGHILDIYGEISGRTSHGILGVRKMLIFRAKEKQCCWTFLLKYAMHDISKYFQFWIFQIKFVEFSLIKSYGRRRYILKELILRVRKPMPKKCSATLFFSPSKWAFFGFWTPKIPRPARRPEIFFNV